MEYFNASKINLNTSITTEEKVQFQFTRLLQTLMLTQTSCLKWPQLYFIPNVVFFPLFISIVGPRPLTLQKAPTHSMLKLESKTAHSLTAKSSIWHFNVAKRNNSSTTSLVQHHAQPVEEHACLMEELFAICLNVFVHLLKLTVTHCKLTNLRFNPLCSAPWRQPSMPKVLFHPQCFTLIIVLELRALKAERVKHKEEM